MRIIIIIILNKGVIRNICSGIINHVIHDPDVIPIDLRIKIGINALIDWWLENKGLDLFLNFLDEKDIRREYEVVIPIDNIIRINIGVFVDLEIVFSIIISFEKNPDMNGTPIRAILFTPKMVKVIGYDFILSPIMRMSW